MRHHRVFYLLFTASTLVSSFGLPQLVAQTNKASENEPHPEVGEFTIPDVLPLSPTQLAHLRERIAKDAEAAAIAEQIIREGESLIEMKSTPLAVIHYEGLVNTDPERIATAGKLRQMGDAARLLRYWQTTGNERAAETLRRLIVAWPKLTNPPETTSTRTNCIRF